MSAEMSEMDALVVVNLILIVVVAGAWFYLRDVANPDSDDQDNLRRRLAMIGFPGGEVLLAPDNLRINERVAPLRVAGQNDPEFVENARAAYERIVLAVARDDLETVEHLLTDEARMDFATFLTARRMRGEIASLIFIGFRAAELLDSGIVGKTAWADVRFGAELVSVVRDRIGKVIEGDPRRIQHCAERWTFEQDLTQRHPKWRLAATDDDG